MRSGTGGLRRVLSYRGGSRGWSRPPVNGTFHPHGYCLGLVQNYMLGPIEFRLRMGKYIRELAVVWGGEVGTSKFYRIAAAVRK